LDSLREAEGSGGKVAGRRQAAIVEDVEYSPQQI